MKHLSIIILLLSFSSSLYSQEFNCKVIVNADQVQNVDKKIFSTLEEAVENFVNTRQWTSDNFAKDERIECVFNLVINNTIQGVEGGFTANLSVQATRPVHNTSYNSTMVNYLDNNVQFKYIQFQPLDFNDNRVSGSNPLASNLPAVLAYYCYIILAIDYDSFELNAGTPYYKKALNVVNNAPENRNISGWEQTDKRRMNRYWLNDQFLDKRFAPLRTSIYKYHRLGLDLLTSKPKVARANMNELFPLFDKVNQDYPSSILLQFFFNAKSDEIVSFLENGDLRDKQTIVPILSRINVRNAQRYNNLLR